MFCMADFCATRENGAGKIDRRKDRDRRQEAEMDLSKYNIGIGITGSFCMFARARKEIRRLTELGANVIPIFSFNAQSCDTRFGSARDYVEGICDITGNEGIRTICAAEPIGPNNYLDIMVIAPCDWELQRQSCATGSQTRRSSWRRRHICEMGNRL